MLAILKAGVTEEQISCLVSWLRHMDLEVRISHFGDTPILALIGDVSRVDGDLLASMEMVDSVQYLKEPFIQANRKFHPQDTVVTVGDVSIGGGHFALIAGPCSVESEEQIIGVAKAV